MFPSAAAATYVAATDVPVARYLANQLPAQGLPPLGSRYNCTGQKIGRGSIGDVVLATDRQDGTKAAIKVVSLANGGLRPDSESASRREIEALTAVSHSNIVSLFGVFYSPTRVPGADDPSRPAPLLCLALELIADSTPLSGLIRHGGSQPALASSVLLQISGALAHLHSRSFVHRDVWSENILIDSDGRAVLVDFGCSASSLPTAFVDAHAKLNVPYMSPEACRRERQQAGDDCWALGCVLTEVVTGVFLADAMGCNTIPVHHRPTVLQNSLVNTYVLGDEGIGDTASELLCLGASNRLSMQELCKRMAVPYTARNRKKPGTLNPKSQKFMDKMSELSGGRSPQRQQGSGFGTLFAGCNGQAATPSSSSSSTMASAVDFMGWGIGSPSVGSPVVIETRQKRHSLPDQRSSAITDLTAGTRVNYMARTHAGEYKAYIMSKVAGRNAVKIKVEGGEEKVVEEADLWRIRVPADRSSAKSPP